MRLAAALPALIAPLLAGCATDALPSFLQAPMATADAEASAVVTGESGIAAGIPAAVSVFPEPPTPEAAAAAAARLTTMPTLYPRQMPEADATGEDFADRVSISPDGRRLVIGTQQGDAVEFQVVSATRKDVQQRAARRGRLDFVGWADARTALLGMDRGGSLHLEAMDIATGKIRTLSDRPGPGGVLAVTTEGAPVTVRENRQRFACADGTPLPTDWRGTPVVQAGPLDALGRVVFRTMGESGALVPFDCASGKFAAPLYEGTSFEGALYDPGGGRYYGVWDEDGPRYFDRSLAFEMREVAQSFPSEVSVWPIEFTRSPNTLLLYVSGPSVPPSYYVLDRYAGALDLHVSYQRAE